MVIGTLEHLNLPGQDVTVVPFLTKNNDEGARLQIFQTTRTTLFVMLTIRAWRQVSDNLEVRGIRNDDPTHTTLRHLDRECPTLKVHRLNGTFGCWGTPRPVRTTVMVVGAVEHLNFPGQDVTVVQDLTKDHDELLRLDVLHTPGTALLGRRLAFGSGRTVDDDFDGDVAYTYQTYTTVRQRHREGPTLYVHRLNGTFGCGIWICRAWRRVGRTRYRREFSRAKEEYISPDIVPRLCNFYDEFLPGVAKRVSPSPLAVYP